jgi:hypothetical protein
MAHVELFRDMFALPSFDLLHSGESTEPRRGSAGALAMPDGNPPREPVLARSTTAPDHNIGKRADSTERATKRTPSSGPESAVIGAAPLSKAALCEEEIEALQPLIGKAMACPRVFLVLGHVALQAPTLPVGMPGVTTHQLETLLVESGTEPMRAKRALHNCLKRALDLKLLHRVEWNKPRSRKAALECWSLSEDGRWFLNKGVKMRQALRKATTAMTTNEEICALVGEQEVVEYREEMLDRAQELGKFQRGQFAAGDSVIERRELVAAIEEQILSCARTRGAQGPWAGLVR